LLSLMTGGFTYLVSEGSILFSVIVAAATAVFGFAKEILEPIKLGYEIRKLKLELWEKKRQRKNEQRSIVQPTSKDIKEYGTPYRVVDRDLLAPFSKTKEPCRANALFRSRKKKYFSVSR